MKTPPGKNRLLRKGLSLFLAVAFLALTSSCSHTPDQSRGRLEMKGQGSSAGEADSARTRSGEDPWWKKPEYEWLIATLVVVGVGIAAGAAIMISSGAGGLSVRVQK